MAQHDVINTASNTHRDPDIRCLGLRCLLQPAVVPVGMVRCIYSRAIDHDVPIVLATAVWGHTWSNIVVLCRCDNVSVVSVTKSRTFKVIHLLRCLHFYVCGVIQEQKIQNLHLEKE